MNTRSRTRVAVPAGPRPSIDCASRTVQHAGVRIEIASILVVSLQRAEDRRANVAFQFGKLHEPAEFELWNAVDGHALARNAPALDAVFRQGLLDRSSKHFSEHPKRAGIIGFSLSYIRILQDIVRRRLNWTLVLEDDFGFCKPHHDFSSLEVADGAEIVSLDTRMNRRGIGTMGTAFSLGAARKILDALPLTASFDVWLVKHCYGVLGGVQHTQSAQRHLFMDTVSYSGANKLIHGSDYRHGPEAVAVSELSYIAEEH